MRFRGEMHWHGKEDQLFETLSYGGLFVDPFDSPQDGYLFTQSQYERFNVPLPPAIKDLCEHGVDAAIYTISNYDPYLLFWKFSDINITQDWEKYTYELLLPSGIVEMDPHKLETFSLAPGQADDFFNEYIARPGFDALPTSITSSIITFLNDVYEPYWCGQQDFMEGVLTSEVARVCGGDLGKVDAYFDLSRWAGVLWLFGPPGRIWRLNNNDLIDTVVSEGEAIIYDGMIYAPSHYRKLKRAAISCYKCGIAAWCVEPTLDDDGIARYICEGCLSRGTPQLPHMTCGAKFCRYWECPHNLWRQQYAGVHEAMRNHGQLAQMVAKRQQLDQGQQQRRLGT